MEEILIERTAGFQVAGWKSEMDRHSLSITKKRKGMCWIN